MKKDKKQSSAKYPRWDTAIEFPENLPSSGRTKLHDVANYFGLAHHSGGQKKTGSRRTLMYPKTLFLEK